MKQIKVKVSEVPAKFPGILVRQSATMFEEYVRKGAVVNKIVEI